MSVELELHHNVDEIEKRVKLCPNECNGNHYFTDEDRPIQYSEDSTDPERCQDIISGDPLGADIARDVGTGTCYNEHTLKEWYVHQRDRGAPFTAPNSRNLLRVPVDWGGEYQTDGKHLLAAVEATEYGTTAHIGSLVRRIRDRIFIPTTPPDVAQQAFTDELQDTVVSIVARLGDPYKLRTVLTAAPECVTDSAFVGVELIVTIIETLSFLGTLSEMQGVPGPVDSEGRATDTVTRNLLLLQVLINQYGVSVDTSLSYEFNTYGERDNEALYYAGPSLAEYALSILPLPTHETPAILKIYRLFINESGAIDRALGLYKIRPRPMVTGQLIGRPGVMVTVPPPNFHRTIENPYKGYSGLSMKRTLLSILIERAHDVLATDGGGELVALRKLILATTNQGTDIYNTCAFYKDGVKHILEIAFSNAGHAFDTLNVLQLWWQSIYKDLDNKVTVEVIVDLI